MYRKLISTFLIISMAFSLCLCTFTSYGSELADTISSMQEQEAQTQQKISDLEKQTKETQDAISALESQKQETQNNVKDLQNQSSTLQSTINGYSSKLDTLNDEITEAESAMAEVSSQIVELNTELEKARKLEQDRYNALKKRIQFSYEKGGSQNLIIALLDSGSLQEFLTKAEYVTSIVSYDRRKLVEYQAIQDDIENKLEVVQEKEAELDAYQETLDSKHAELAELTDNVRSQLSTTNSNLSSEKNKLATYNEQLATLDEKMKSLESQTAAAQAELAKQIAERLALTREDTSGAYTASDNELVWLAATIQAEAGGESYTGKLAVGSVIMNRVKSSAFPNNVIDVITQNMQFASYRSGKVELIISNGPNSTCIQAANEVLAGARVGDYLFFMTKYYADYYGISEYTMIGNHAFFYRWVTNKKSEDTTSSTDNSSSTESTTTTDSNSSTDTTTSTDSNESTDSTQSTDSNESSETTTTTDSNESSETTDNTDSTESKGSSENTDSGETSDDGSGG